MGICKNCKNCEKHIKYRGWGKVYIEETTSDKEDGEKSTL
jgi:hypothetical protein